MFKHLLKLEFLNLMNFKSAKRRNQSIGTLLISIGLLLFIIFVSFTYGNMISLLLWDVGMLESMPLVLYGIITVVLLLFGMFYTSENLFKFKDFDLLRSLPLDLNLILSAKLCFTYIMNVIFTAAILIPATLAWNIQLMTYQSSLDFSLGFGGLALIFGSVFFLPLVPMFIANAIGVFISFISKHFKHKNLLNIIASIIFVIPVFYFIFAGIITESGLTQFFTVFVENIRRFLPTSILFGKLATGSIGAFILFTVISLALTAVFIYIVTRYFDTIHSSLQSSVRSNKKQKLTYKANGSFKNLLKKEWQSFIAIPTFAMNTITFSILALVACVYILSVGIDPQILVILKEKPIFTVAMPMTLGMLASISPSTTCSISLEGNRFWQMRVLPIASKDILLAKVLFNILLNIPVTIFASITAFIVLELDIFTFLLMLILPLLNTTLFSFIGLFFNIQHPNFEWTNPNVVVKQSFPVIGTLLCAMLGNGLIVAVIFMSATITGMLHLGNILVMIALLVANTFCYLHIKKKADVIMSSFF